MKSYKKKSGAAPIKANSSSKDELALTTAVPDSSNQLSNPEEPALDDGKHQVPEVDEGSATSNAVRPSDGNGSVPPTRQQVLLAIAFWAVILLGAALRFWGLGDKPLHHDESQHAYFSLQLLHNLENWSKCFSPTYTCYRYDPLLHGPFQFHIIALVYKLSQLLGVYDNGVNNVTARIAAASLGTLIVALPYFLRDRLGTIGAWIACFLLATSPGMVYFSRFTREDIYMASFTFLLVVAVARYLRSRKMSWLIIASLAFTLSYATKEATFLTVAVFGSFMGALLVWELGKRWPLRISINSGSASTIYLTQTGAPVLVAAYFLVLAIIAKFFFGWLHTLSLYITDPNNTTAANDYVSALKDRTQLILLLVAILLLIYVLSILIRQMLGMLPRRERWGIARKIDPARQPLLNTILTMRWSHWFVALVISSLIFLLLFTVLFTNFPRGIGDGVWQGLYYWLQQQQVARGGQPWYYYLMLIPLYEQIGLVSGIVGIVRSLLRPTRFRLFLVYWFAGNVFIYSWAAEKMPWLMIHITLPMLLLAAIGLELVVTTVIDLVKDRFARPVVTRATGRNARNPIPTIPALALQQRPGATKLVPASAALVGLLAALLLLLPTLHNMYEVSYVHQADAPHEMMIYVQTNTDVNIVMAKIDKLDQELYGGKHLLSIGVLNDATWPFAWYLRDYTNVCFNFPQACPTFANTAQVLISGQDNLPMVQTQYKKDFMYHQYHMRSQWDQGYMPPACVSSATNPCTEVQQYTGVGPLLWLSYGDNPPPGAQFDPGRAISNVWQWWWQRKAIGSTDGSYDMALLIRKGLSVSP